MTDNTAPTAGPDPTHALDRLHRIVAARRGADPAESYTAKLYARGVPKIAQKTGEEAVETVIEAVRLAEGGGDRDALVGESADLLYHLTVLWAALDIDPAEVWARLDARHGTSGFDAKKAEKASKTGG
jgi:phosphoribosyl-ATP pyrophosphohydrolase